MLWSLLSGCGASYPELVSVSPTAEPVCLVGGRVLVGEGLEPHWNSTVCLAGGRISLVTTDPEHPLPAGVAAIDVRGQTVLPGLIDTHVHVTGTDSPPWRFRRPDPAHNLQAWLRVGITTVYDLGGSTEDLRDLAEQVEAGALPGPQILYGHEPITAVGGHPIPAILALLPWPVDRAVASQVPTVSVADEAATLVASMRERGAGHLKIIHDALPPGSPQLDTAVLQALVSAGHAHRLPVFVHVGSNQDALDAVAAGADHLAHGVYKEPLSSAVVTALADRGVSVTVTAAGFDNTREMSAGRYTPEAAVAELSDPAIVASVSGEAGAAFAEQEVLGEFALTIVERATLRDNVARLHQGGVVVLPGTDSPIAGVFPGGSYREELALLAEAGIPPEVLVRRATVDAARLRSGPGPLSFGAIVEGARADVLVVKGDPQADVRALNDVAMVFAKGRRVVLH